MSKPKKETAHHVEVLLLQVHRPGKGLGVVPSRQLSWADTPDERLAIPSGTWRRVDILKLVTGGNATRSVLTPALKEYPASKESAGRDLLAEDGRYRFDLAVSADEIESSRWQFEFNYRGGLADSIDGLRSQLTFGPAPLQELRPSR